MILDLEKARSLEQADHDVCILGAGAAGISLAVELVRRGRKVLLLEGGRADFNPRSQDLYRGESDGLPFQGLYDGRFRVLGGSTTQWGGQILEIDDFVFEPRAWVEGGRWPISKSELEPWYRRAVELEGLERALDDADAVWRGLQVDRPDYGPELISLFSRWCPVTDFWRLHGPELEKSPLATVYTGANACELRLAEDGRTVRAVRCKTYDGRVVDFAARAFVVCMGGIESCRFLLQPTAEGGTPPWNRHGRVGRHFQDHICSHLATIAPSRPELVSRWFDYVSVGGMRYHPKFHLAPEAQQRLGTLDVCGTVAFTTGGRDDLAMAFQTFRLLKTRRFANLSVGRVAHFARHFPTLLWHKLPYWQGAQDAARADRVLKLAVHCEQSPLSEGSVGLSSERDAFGLFRTRLSWRASEQERRSIRAFLKTAQTAFAAGGLGVITPDAGVLEDDAALDATFQDSNHHLGGLCMGTSPETGVVDADLALFGTANAYVCSTAVFPSGGYVNPTHTLIALAARLAQHLSVVAPAQARPEPVEAALQSVA